jgi:hypothetical protein
MNLQMIIAEMKKAHNPSMVEESQGGHVQELWQDGEVTLTKGGDLFRARSLHMIEFPVLSKENSQEVALGFGDNASANISVYVNNAECTRIREMMGQL